MYVHALWQTIIDKNILQLQLCCHIEPGGVRSASSCCSFRALLVGSYGLKAVIPLHNSLIIQVHQVTLCSNRLAVTPDHLSAHHFFHRKMLSHLEALQISRNSLWFVWALQTIKPERYPCKLVECPFMDDSCWLPNITQTGGTTIALLPQIYTCTCCMDSQTIIINTIKTRITRYLLYQLHTFRMVRA